MSRIALLGIGCLLAFALIVVSIYWVLRDDNIDKRLEPKTPPRIKSSELLAQQYGLRGGGEFLR